MLSKISSAMMIAKTINQPFKNVSKTSSQKLQSLMSEMLGRQWEQVFFTGD